VIVTDLAAIEPEWFDLYRRSPAAAPFQSPAWLLPWWRAFGSSEACAIALRDEGLLTSFAPFYIVRDEDESLGMFIGTGISDYLDMLGNDGRQVLIELAAADCQMWDLQQLRPSSPLLHAALPEGWSDTVIDGETCPRLSIAGAGDELQNLISNHFRKKIRYYRRAMERQAPVAVESANESNLDELLTALFELHAARWQSRGLPGVLADDVAQRFHRQAARAMLHEGELRMYATRMGERIVAVFYGFEHAGTVNYYLSGYDPELEKLSIGTLIVAHAIEQAVRDGATTFDFLRGAEEYKYAWGAIDARNSQRQLYKG